jgi:hypothetical protein
MNADYTDQDALLKKTGVRRLAPAETKIFEGTFSLLHCAVTGDDLYRGVFAVRMFPIRYPDQFISLRYTTTDDKEKEIGIIENLNAFDAQSQALIRASLVKHYYEQIICGIRGIEYKYGLLFFKVVMAVDQTERDFIMRWSTNSAEEYGEHGKVLIDVHENRYILPDVNQLPTSERREFTSYIYW